LKGTMPSFGVLKGALVVAVMVTVIVSLLTECAI